MDVLLESLLQLMVALIVYCIQKRTLKVVYRVSVTSPPTANILQKYFKVLSKLKEATNPTLHLNHILHDHLFIQDLF